MERLTAQSEILNEYRLQDNSVNGCQKAINKLADYEDAEEQGLLLRLPCKVGDTVYVVLRGDIIPLAVDSFICNEKGIKILGRNERYWGNGTITLYPDKRIVEWFLSQAEAEQALADKGV